MTQDRSATVFYYHIPSDLSGRLGATIVAKYADGKLRWTASLCHPNNTFDEAAGLCTALRRLRHDRGIRPLKDLPAYHSPQTVTEVERVRLIRSGVIATSKRLARGESMLDCGWTAFDDTPKPKEEITECARGYGKNTTAKRYAEAYTKALFSPERRNEHVANLVDFLCSNPRLLDDANVTISDPAGDVAVSVIRYLKDCISTSVASNESLLRERESLRARVAELTAANQSLVMERGGFHDRLDKANNYATKLSTENKSLQEFIGSRNQKIDDLATKLDVAARHREADDITIAAQKESVVRLSNENKGLRDQLFDMMAQEKVTVSALAEEREENRKYMTRRIDVEAEHVTMKVRDLDVRWNDMIDCRVMLDGQDQTRLTKLTVVLDTNYHDGMPQVTMEVIP